MSERYKALFGALTVAAVIGIAAWLAGFQARLESAQRRDDWRAGYAAALNDVRREMAALAAPPKITKVGALQIQYGDAISAVCVMPKRRTTPDWICTLLSPEAVVPEPPETIPTVKETP